MPFSLSLSLSLSLSFSLYTKLNILSLSQHCGDLKGAGSRSRASQLAKHSIPENRLGKTWGAKAIRNSQLHFLIHFFDRKSTKSLLGFSFEIFMKNQRISTSNEKP